MFSVRILSWKTFNPGTIYRPDSSRCQIFYQSCGNQEAKPCDKYSDSEICRILTSSSSTLFRVIDRACATLWAKEGERRYLSPLSRFKCASRARERVGEAGGGCRLVKKWTLAKVSRQMDKRESLKNVIHGELMISHL